MGNLASEHFNTNIESWTNPEVVPNVKEKPKHDPNYGFKTPREERVSTLTEADMYWAKIAPNKRDYCAQHYIDMLRCRREEYPFISKCLHFKHEWDNCQNEDIVYRMKEFERERRLLKREQRLKAKQQVEQA